MDGILQPLTLGLRYDKVKMVGRLILTVVRCSSAPLPKARAGTAYRRGEVKVVLGSDCLSAGMISGLERLSRAQLPDISRIRQSELGETPGCGMVLRSFGNQ